MQDSHASSSSRPRSPRRAARIAWLAAVLGAGIALGIGIASRYAQAPHQGMVVLTEDQANAQRAAMRQRDAELQGLRTRLDTTTGEMAIERAARIELEEQLKLAQAEAGRARDQLAFFEQLLPAGPEGTVDIRGTQIDRAGKALAYKVLLMRSGRPGDAAFSGRLRFHAVGTLKDRKAEFDLLPLRIKEEPSGKKPAAAKPQADKVSPLAVHFEQYQRSQGMLELPEGFVPESVTVSVLEGDTVRASRTVTLILSPTSPGL
ncbi:integral membrane protein [Bordetella ansorpii]|uniref:Integral membrane protein n=1 Tax=Bordetella ansorpii TaxID=288768 RepID=A0A157SRE5_9BORD|nr:DUF6776 family protein [Bordetella ansorpii]SAI72874.1 integral membrane protein [Bordetella ansorpii]